MDVLKLSQADIFRFVVAYLPATLLVAFIFIYIEVKREGSSSFKLLIPKLKPKKNIPVLCYFTPMIPFLIILVSSLVRLYVPSAKDFEFPILAALLMGIIYGSLTMPKSSGEKSQIFIRAFFDGMVQVRAAIF